MYDDNQDSTELICTPEALVGALRYLHAEATMSDFQLAAHLILAAAQAVEDMAAQRDEPEEIEHSQVEGRPEIRLVHSGQPKIPAPSGKVNEK